ncbi:undecaprenyl-phosphate glucose phosphotransferase [Segatella maculosa]|uniref:undecaprenyl-phosphate glucose phosphotransferase n=1 Tax=Segatella maculosa TaxID=439703 RepID=UPI002492EE0A|nr:undecaprenyl-phosphate glucose phosphotransferase [Segatella maculosa]
MKQNLSRNDFVRQLVTISDFVIINVILVCLIELLPNHIPLYFHNETKITLFVVNAAMGIAQYFFQTIVHYRRIDFDKIFLRVSQLVITHVIITYVLLSFLSPKENFFHISFLYAVTSFAIIIISRFVERSLLNYLRQAGHNSRQVVLVGHDQALIELYKAMTSDPAMGYQVRGYYANREMKNCPHTLAYLGSLDDFDKAMQTSDVLIAEEIFCCLSHDYNDFIAQIMRYCDANVIRFFYLPRMFGTYRLRLKPEYMGDILLYTNHTEPLSFMGNRLIKRTFDLVVSAFACLCLLPFIPIIALIIKMQSPGSVFFIQERTGFEGHPFKCYKFRSMYTNANANTEQATKDDPRKFPFGNLMRRTNIDELPQFWNVLKGDMSIVGPRPHMLHHTEVYSGLIDKYMVRHFCKPGITGLAQVTGYRGETKELWQMQKRVELDIWYIEHWSFILDLRIILKTAYSIIVPDKHAY